ncbi:uncharacterized protein LOC117330439 [Pecten maximus]|uniref:uncharacterized protein LOC117330439 n=1 Tax=Pecten maximus TaxID=6579 RepID=UPI001458629C|nr:uncharacterized protein LOC117330439 [Pecten maximus]
MDHWSVMLIAVLAGTVTASTNTFQFRYNCGFLVHTLLKNEVALVRFSGLRLPESHCSIGFRGSHNETTVCVVSQPPFTLSLTGPTLILSQGSDHVHRKTYSSLSIVSPSRYCTSGGRYLNIALDNGNSGSSTSRDRGYFALKVTANYPSPSRPSDGLPVVVIVAPVAGSVVFIAMVIIFFVMYRRRMRVN